MSGVLRVVDSGVRGARENLAVTAALAALHRDGRCPDTLRFQHFRPAAIIGRHQVLADEVHLDHVADRGIETARRMTGGGAIYMGPGMLGFELIVARSRLPGSLEAITATLCTALAGALSTFGIAARFRPRNDVEVEGRKICGTGGYADGGTLVFQGTVLREFEVADMAAALRLPVGKLDRKGLRALADRVTSLKALLGEPPPMRAIESVVAPAFAAALGLAPAWSQAPTTDEEDAAKAAFAAEIGLDSFVQGDGMGCGASDVAATLSTGGGTMTASARLAGSGPDCRLERLWLTGDFFATPARVVPDLEAALAGVPLAGAAAAAEAFLERANADILGATRGDIAGLIGRLADAPSREPLQQKAGDT
jgi:lipoate-protein ligase A